MLCRAVHLTQLQAKTDDAFVKGAFRLCRDHLGIRTVLTPAQFLEQVSTTSCCGDTPGSAAGSTAMSITGHHGSAWRRHVGGCGCAHPLAHSFDCSSRDEKSAVLCVHLLQGYAERKVLLLCDVVRAAKELHAAGAKQERAKVQAACRQVGLVGVPAGGRRQGCGALALALTDARPHVSPKGRANKQPACSACWLRHGLCSTW